MGRALEKSFRPGWQVLEEGPKQDALASSGLGRTVSGYLRVAERYGKSDRLSDEDGAMGDRTGEAGKVVDRLVSAGGSSDGAGAAAERMENPFQRVLVATVRVVQAVDGSVERVELAGSSGFGSLDRAALAAARSSAASLPPGAASDRARSTTWAFLARFEVLPPAPFLACPLDALLEGEAGRCAYPLKKTVSARVELRAIE